jgi:hypothetical protein
MIRIYLDVPEKKQTQNTFEMAERQGPTMAAARVILIITCRGEKLSCYFEARFLGERERSE